MLFNSLEFAVFLPIVFLLYWFVFNRKLRLQNAFIVLASYVFYGWWDWRFLILMAATTFFSWVSGVLIQKVRNGTYENIKHKLRIISVANIVLNIGILGYFKYYNFFIDSFVSSFTFFGGELSARSLNIILPVGISFYTFQALSYTIDVYREKIQPTKDIVSFFAFVSFFPQLVAGPIERATNLLPQFQTKRIFEYDKAVDGMRQILWGLFKKIVIADNCAVFVNDVFANYETLSGSTLLLGAVFFAFQIYGDFSGYSDIAIGTGRLFGINLMRNFNFPYFSRDIAEFWRRWHISLTTWFRDYIYIPLGGSRGGTWMKVRNTFIIFLVSGFWHGANWTFIVWGAFHALLFLPLIILKQNRKHTDTVAEGRLFPNLKELSQILITFFLVVIGWVFFRADTITMAFDYLSNLFSDTLFTLPQYEVGMKKTGFSIAVLLIVEWIQRNKNHALNFDIKISPILRWAVYIILIIFILEIGAESQSFIYFQF